MFFAGKIALMALVHQVFFEKKELTAAEQAAQLEAGDAEDNYSRVAEPAENSSMANFAH